VSKKQDATSQESFIHSDLQQGIDFRAWEKLIVVNDGGPQGLKPD
jgi:hypothetical protein